MKRSLLLAILLLSSTALLAQDRINGLPFATRSEVIAEHGMVATSQPLATIAALEVLKNGGNAIDAAIAANAVLGVVEPTGNGIGGDLFAIVWSAKDQRLYGLNASGRSAKGLSLSYFQEQGMDQIPAYGPLPVTVPGCVDGWFELHGKFGSLPMADILAPAIGYAEKGFPLSQLIAYYWAGSTRAFMRRGYPGYAENFTIDGRAPREGEIFKRPNLANTLRIIAEKGRDEFYEGDIAKQIVEYIQGQGGFLAMEDFTSHRSQWVEPVSTNYRGYDVWELPPNGQGIAALQMLNILEGYDLKGMGFHSPQHVHTFIEAKKLVFEDRARYYSDPDFNKLPIEWLISKEYAEQRRALIDEHEAGRSYEPGEPPREGDTIYLCVADKDGNMVSLIQSNFRGMGSGMVPPKLGFMLQDRGELFSLEEGHMNVFEPGKRPFHTIIPAFVTKDGQPFMALGVMGGDFQPLGHVQIISNIIDFGMNAQEAGDAPRIDHAGSTPPDGKPSENRMDNGGIILHESGLPAYTIHMLEQMGHRLRQSLGNFGGYQSIIWDAENGVYRGASESRKDGMAAGY